MAAVCRWPAVAPNHIRPTRGVCAPVADPVRQRSGRFPREGGTQLRTGSIFSSAWVISFDSVGRTSRATSAPASRKMSVGHSFTLNDRPNGRPGPSAILKCRTSAWPTIATAISGCARRQWPHQALPNSISAGPANRSICDRVGSSEE